MTDQAKHSSADVGKTSQSPATNPATQHEKKHEGPARSEFTQPAPQPPGANTGEIGKIKAALKQVAKALGGGPDAKLAQDLIAKL